MMDPVELLMLDDGPNLPAGPLWPKLSWGCNIAFAAGLIGLFVLAGFVLWLFGWLIS